LKAAADCGKAEDKGGYRAKRYATGCVVPTSRFFCEKLDFVLGHELAVVLKEKTDLGVGLS
jgi:hypothetical protein